MAHHSQPITIVPLSKNYLLQAIRLVNRLFPDESGSPGQDLAGSIDGAALIAYRAANPEVLTLNYYLALNHNQQLVGIVGLYSLAEDYWENTLWLGWYGVTPRQRNKKIGKTLLEYAIERARERKATQLCLYTSTSPEEARAQQLYDRYGFEITARVSKPHYELLYRRKKL